MSMKFDEYT